MSTPLPSSTKPSGAMWAIFVVLIVLAIGMTVWFAREYRNYKQIIDNERNSCPTYYCDATTAGTNDPTTQPRAWRLNAGKQEWQERPTGTAQTGTSS